MMGKRILKKTIVAVLMIAILLSKGGLLPTVSHAATTETTEKN